MNFSAPGNGSSGGPTTDPQLQIAQGIIQTFEVQTQIAQAVQQTMAAQVSDTPARPLETSSPTFTFTPQNPMVSVSVETNCRSGPGTAFEILGVLQVGQYTEVVGRSANSDNWIIKLPSNPSVTCWLWAMYATVAGDTAGVSVIASPPTPTPVADFNVVYVSLEACKFSSHAIKFLVANLGGITWESYSATSTDLVTAESNTSTLNYFPNYGDPECVELSSDPRLDPGQAGYASSMAFNNNPTGHWVSATIRVCSQDGMLGICLEKTITFSP